jgi:soluble cytochrome b562
MDKSFLDKEESPTIDELIGLFFNVDDTNTIKSLRTKLLSGPEEIPRLGKPKEIEDISGAVWIATKITWDTIAGLKYLIVVNKASELRTLTDDLFENFTHYPLTDITTHNTSNDTMDISYGIVEEGDDYPVNNEDYYKLINNAIESEDFEEAARLKKWKDGLDELLEELKPKINKALSEGNLSALDNNYKLINTYRRNINNQSN